MTSCFVSLQSMPGWWEGCQVSISIHPSVTFNRINCISLWGKLSHCGRKIATTAKTVVVTHIETDISTAPRTEWVNMKLMMDCLKNLSYGFLTDHNEKKKNVTKIRAAHSSRLIQEHKSNDQRHPSLSCFISVIISEETHAKQGAWPLSAPLSSSLCPLSHWQFQHRTHSPPAEESLQWIPSTVGGGGLRRGIQTGHGSHRSTVLV